MAYRNAKDVLTPELLSAVQACHAGLLWIPKTTDTVRQRRRRVLRLFAKGLGVADVAAKVGLSPRRVRQIRQEAAMSRGDGFSSGREGERDRE
jgi:DNA-binding NarL/FixJ family response regulator